MNRIGISTTLLVLAAACAAAGDRPLTTHRVPLERVASMDPLQSSAVYDSRAVSLVYEPGMRGSGRPAPDHPSRAP